MSDISQGLGQAWVMVGPLKQGETLGLSLNGNGDCSESLNSVSSPDSQLVRSLEMARPPALFVGLRYFIENPESVQLSVSTSNPGQAVFNGTCIENRQTAEAENDPFYLDCIVRIDSVTPLAWLEVSTVEGGNNSTLRFDRAELIPFWQPSGLTYRHQNKHSLHWQAPPNGADSYRLMVTCENGIVAYSIDTEASEIVLDPDVQHLSPGDGCNLWVAPVFENGGNWSEYAQTLRFNISALRFTEMSTSASGPSSTPTSTLALSSTPTSTLALSSMPSSTSGPVMSPEVSSSRWQSTPSFIALLVMLTAAFKVVLP